MDSRTPRDGKAIEELGYYDPMVKDTDARAILKSERLDYWLSVGAQPSDNVRVLIKKYGTNGTHVEQQKAALARIATTKPMAPPPVAIPASEPKQEEAPAEEAAAEATETETAEPEATAEEAAEESDGPKPEETE